LCTPPDTAILGLASGVAPCSGQIEERSILGVGELDYRVADLAARSDRPRAFSDSPACAARARSLLRLRGLGVDDANSTPVI
jgi:hypothetical protein